MDNYLAGGQEYMYPAAGDPMPPEDTIRSFYYFVCTCQQVHAIS
jgi:hypothetical protein